MSYEKITPCSIRIKEAMNDKGIKQIEIAKALNVSRSTISMYCSGKIEPKRDMIYKLANILSVNPAWLMGLDVPKNIDNTISQDFFIKNLLDKPHSKETDWLLVEMYRRRYADTYLNEYTMRLLTAYIEADPAIKSAVEKLLDMGEKPNESP